MEPSETSVKLEEEMESDASLLSPVVAGMKGDGETGGNDPKDERHPGLIPIDVGSGEVPAVEIPGSEKGEKERDDSEHVECGAVGSDVKVSRKRGRKRKRPKSDECDGDDGFWMKKVKVECHEFRTKKVKGECDEGAARELNPANEKDIDTKENGFSGRSLRSRSVVRRESERLADSGQGKSANVQKIGRGSVQGNRKYGKVEEDVSYELETPKKRRGHPPKTSTELLGNTGVVRGMEEDVSNDLETPKKRRGRPPKKSTELLGSTGVVKGTEEDVSKVQETPNKRRGRPPKSSTELLGSTGVVKGMEEDVSNDLETPNKRKGRLPKISTELLGSTGVVHGMTGDIKGGKRSLKLKRAFQSANDVKGATKTHEDRKKLIGTLSGIEGSISNKKNKIGDLNEEDTATPHGKKTKGADACTVKKRKISISGVSTQVNDKVVRARSTQKQLLRSRIIDILLKCCWTIEYKPRSGKDYMDSVYVSPDGRSYWSVTLAYSVLKKQYENAAADGNDQSSSFAFTPIPDEELQILARITQKKKEKNKWKKKQKAAGGIAKDCLGKKSSKKQKSGDHEGSFRHKGKRIYIKGSDCKSLKGTMHCQQDSSINTSLPSKLDGRRKPLQKTKNRKRGALLVRRSKKDGDSEFDGYIPYNGKRSVLSWMIDLGTVPLNGMVTYMNARKTRVMLDGKITRNGIHCGCCDEIVTISEFESHAGSKLCRASQYICLETGVSLLQCQLDAWNKQDESERKGFFLVEEKGDDDPNDDTCGICGDGGDLICCDGCPSTFHLSCLDIQKFPSGDWHCAFCSCRSCGSFYGASYERNGKQIPATSELLTCLLCEQKYHHLCVHLEDTQQDGINSPSFCGESCQELFEKLQMLLGVKHELGEGFSWTFIRRSEVSSDTCVNNVRQEVECNSKLAVAYCVMDECFVPIFDDRSGFNTIRNILYNCGSNFNRLNYSGFITAVLEKDDDIIAAASIRIHGNCLAEMPFIGTRHIYRRQGMCRRLLAAIECGLRTLGVKKLVIPAISELKQTWTSVFGFRPVHLSNRKETKHMNMLVFPGIDMLQKPLLKDEINGENPIPSAAVKFSKRKEAPKNLTKLKYDGCNSLAGEDTIHLRCSSNDNTSALASSLQLPEGSSNHASDITSVTDNLPESSTGRNCIANKQCIPEEIINCKNEVPPVSDSVRERHIDMQHVKAACCVPEKECGVGIADLEAQKGYHIQHNCGSTMTQQSGGMSSYKSVFVSLNCHGDKNNLLSSGAIPTSRLSSSRRQKLLDSGQLSVVEGTLNIGENMLDTQVNDEVPPKELKCEEVDEGATGNVASVILPNSGEEITGTQRVEDDVPSEERICAAVDESGIADLEAQKGHCIQHNCGSTMTQQSGGVSSYKSVFVSLNCHCDKNNLLSSGAIPTSRLSSSSGQKLLDNGQLSVVEGTLNIGENMLDTQVNDEVLPKELKCEEVDEGATGNVASVILPNSGEEIIGTQRVEDDVPSEERICEAVDESGTGNVAPEVLTNFVSEISGSLGVKDEVPSEKRRRVAVDEGATGNVASEILSDCDAQPIGQDVEKNSHGASAGECGSKSASADKCRIM